MINVLIVEDDLMVAKLNKRYLEMLNGFKLIGMVTNGKEALDFITNSSEPIQLILLDIFMPNMDGLTLLEKIRSLNNNIDVIMITATSNSADIQVALNLGIIDYLVKPFTFERFKSALISCQKRLQILNENSTLDQSKLDQFIFNATDPIKKQRLPKGIDQETLNNVETLLQGMPSEFSINDLVDKISLSRISLKKYIDYLHDDKKILSSKLEYQSVGRPVRIYKYIK